MTKCGRYGLDASEFDYSPATIRESVARSLGRLNTDYLDVVYLHDVEFVASPVYPKDRAGNPADVLLKDSSIWGLGGSDRGKVLGEGDKKVLLALAELFQLKAEGKVRAVGITGYSLPVLLRLAILAAGQSHLGPLDTVLSFCHLTLQNSSLLDFLPYFAEQGHVSQVLSASPLAMGLLTSNPPPWHPAPDAILAVSKQADELCKEDGLDLSVTALHYSVHDGRRAANSYTLPTVLGLSTLNEVHRAMEVLRPNYEHENTVRNLQKTVEEMYKCVGYHGWSWVSPP